MVAFRALAVAFHTRLALGGGAPRPLALPQRGRRAGAADGREGAVVVDVVAAVAGEAPGGTALAGRDGGHVDHATAGRPDVVHVGHVAAVEHVLVAEATGRRLVHGLAGRVVLDELDLLPVRLGLVVAGAAAAVVPRQLL